MAVSKILIIDDQYGIRVLLTEVFQDETYETYEASNGNQALQIYKDKKPDIVLLDMKMAGMDGIEILERLKEIDEDAQVIMMTAYGELELIQEAQNLGAKEHFSKPFDINELKDKVDEMIQHLPK